MMASGAGAHEGFAVGWYGKIPGTGDFIARRVPGTFSEPWDRWLQGAIEGSTSSVVVELGSTEHDMVSATTMIRMQPK